MYKAMGIFFFVLGAVCATAVVAELISPEDIYVGVVNSTEIGLLCLAAASLWVGHLFYTYRGKGFY